MTHTLQVDTNPLSRFNMCLESGFNPSPNQSIEPSLMGHWIKDMKPNYSGTLADTIGTQLYVSYTKVSLIQW